MATSDDIMQQLQQYQNAGNVPQQITNSIKQAYQGPVGTLINEGNQLRQQYYPALFASSQKYGTGAGDMDPAAALQAMVGDSERAGANYNTNTDLRNYYDTTINNLASQALQGYNTGYQTLKDQYNMAFQKEQADRQYALQQQQLAAARAAAANPFASLGTGGNVNSAMQNAAQNGQLNIAAGLKGTTSPLSQLGRTMVAAGNPYINNPLYVNAQQAATKLPVIGGLAKNIGDLFNWAGGNNNYIGNNSGPGGNGSVGGAVRYL